MLIKWHITSKIIKISLYCALLATSSCKNTKYTEKDGEKIFTNIAELTTESSLAFTDVEPLIELEDICMNVTDFDYQNYGISMNSYPKIDLSDYKKYFSRNGDLDFYIHPIICNGMVYDVKKDGKIVAYQLINERVKKVWSKELLTKEEKKNIILLNARLDDDKLYISTSNGYVISFDTLTKNILWKKQYNSSFSASPTVYEKALYLISAKDEIFAINIENGDVMWTFKDEEENNIKSFQIPPVAIYHGKVVAGLSNGFVVVLDKDRGDIIWKNKIVPSKTSGNIVEITDIDFPPVLFDDVLVVGDIKSSVMGFDFKTGQPLWQIPTGLNSYMFVNRQGFGFFVNNNNENICFYTKNGAIKWIKSDNSSFFTEHVPAYLNNGKTKKVLKINRYFDAV